LGTGCSSRDASTADGRWSHWRRRAGSRRGINSL